MRHGHVLAGLGEGAIGGGIGTAVMSGVMLAARRAGLMSQQPPEAITEAALDATGIHERDEKTQDMLASVLHFGFGISVGGIFGMMHRSVRVHPVLGGIAFATLVWATSYQGWVPALGIMPPASSDEPGRPITMLLAHWVYGATLGAIISWCDSRTNSNGDDDA